MAIYNEWASETAKDWIVIPSKVKLTPLTKDVEKANPYHDKLGRFTFGPTAGGVVSSLPPKALAKCKEIEAESVKLPYEQVTAIDDVGAIIFQKDGTKNHVSLDYEERMDADGKILTHNHPGEYGGTFSEGDIGIFLGVYAEAIRAVGAEGTYSLERGNAEYEEVYSFAQAAVKEHRRIGAQFTKARDSKRADVAEGKMSEDDANKELGALRKDLLSSMSTKYEELAKQYNLHYTFEPSGKVKKANPYHDPKTGRFTNKPGGTGSKFVRPQPPDESGIDVRREGESKEEARARRLKYIADYEQYEREMDEAFSKVDKRIGDLLGIPSYNVGLRHALDPDEMETFADEIEAFTNKFPQVKGEVYALRCFDFGKMFGKEYEDAIGCFNETTKEIELNERFYKNGKKELKKALAEDVNGKFHPQATSTSIYIHHELAHALDDCTSKLTGERASNVNFLEEKGVAEMAGKQFNAKSVTNELSEYATVSRKEFFAEAISEYVSSPNPRPMAKRVGERTKQLLSE